MHVANKILRTIHSTVTMTTMMMTIIIGVHDYSVNDAIILKFIAIVIGFICRRVLHSHTSRQSGMLINLGIQLFVARLYR